KRSAGGSVHRTAARDSFGPQYFMALAKRSGKTTRTGCSLMRCHRETPASASEVQARIDECAWTAGWQDRERVLRPERWRSPRRPVPIMGHAAAHQSAPAFESQPATEEK